VFHILNLTPVESGQSHPLNLRRDARRSTPHGILDVLRRYTLSAATASTAPRWTSAQPISRCGRGTQTLPNPNAAEPKRCGTQTLRNPNAAEPNRRELAWN